MIVALAVATGLSIWTDPHAKCAVAVHGQCLFTNAQQVALEHDREPALRRAHGWTIKRTIPWRVHASRGLEHFNMQAPPPYHIVGRR